ncbi:hypothetical protein NJT12_20685 [Flavobacterium sp. AC]|uniref:Lipoprotein n=1 Tax=Flavobacterium azizsancarii TaxID=2961580 RepID=A0ABT4WHM1_9FLAO|nr:hypothetical protein [Flavobacterium azizsancarii]MDA6072046.1 hypothetical protein [Flavobacterium azizsancarii]
MRRNVLMYFAFIFFFSCNQIKEDQSNAKENLIKTESVTEKKSSKSSAKIVLGDDKDEINALVKNIYEINGEVFIDLDFVQIKFKNVDERVVINENPKIRTYKVDSESLIYSKDCKTLNLKELIRSKSKILRDKTIILVGEAKGGRMQSLNFGCYG